jgi:hypothetical protein
MVEWPAPMMERWNSWRCLLANLLLRCVLVPLAELPIRSLAILGRVFALTLWTAMPLAGWSMELR